MGLRLRDARLARDINPRDLETELRTTYRHLLAIEEGQMRLFYSDSFFCDLFTRYAVQLGFSVEQAQDMRLALHGEGPLVEQAEPADQQAEEHQAEEYQAEEHHETEGSHEEPVPTADSDPLVEPPVEPTTVVEPAAESSPEAKPQPQLLPVAEPPPAWPEPAPITTATSLDSPPQNHDSRPDQPTRPSEASQSLGSLWFWGAIALGLVLAVVVLTLEPTADAPTSAASTSTPKPQTSAQASAVVESKQGSGASPQTDRPQAQEPSKAQASQAQDSGTQPPSLASSAPATASANAANTASTAPQEAATPAPELSRERRISEAILVSTLDAPTSFSAGAAMSIRFNVKGWVWVREFDDNVREFVVQSGQTVRFNDLPVFLVVPFPDQLTVRVENQPVTLRRNDDEKNHARYSRSMLRGLVTNP